MNLEKFTGDVKVSVIEAWKPIFEERLPALQPIATSHLNRWQLAHAKQHEEFEAKVTKRLHTIHHWRAYSEVDYLQSYPEPVITIRSKNDSSILIKYNKYLDDILRESSYNADRYQSDYESLANYEGGRRLKDLVTHYHEFLVVLAPQHLGQDSVELASIESIIGYYGNTFLLKDYVDLVCKTYPRARSLSIHSDRMHGFPREPHISSHIKVQLDECKCLRDVFALAPDREWKFEGRTYDQWMDIIKLEGWGGQQEFTPRTEVTISGKFMYSNGKRLGVDHVG